MTHDPAGRIGSLIRLAGERDRPSAEGMERARELARASWQRSLTDRAQPSRLSRRSMLRYWPLAVAAGTVLLAVVMLRMFTPPPAAAEIAIARVAAVHGEVRLARQPAALARDAIVARGDLLDTAGGRIALVIGDSLSLRLAERTRVRFEAPGEITVLDGALYVDSGGLQAGTALRIRTPAGVVQHVGTQFQVRVDGPRTRVQVREGRVTLDAPDRDTVDLSAGDLLEVREGVLELERGTVPYGAAWEWAAMLTSGFDIENRPLTEFLAWLAREHGWQLRYADPAIFERARKIRLHGSLQGLDAIAMLERTSLVTGLDLQVADGVLWARAGR